MSQSGKEKRDSIVSQVDAPDICKVYTLQKDPVLAFKKGKKIPKKKVSEPEELPPSRPISPTSIKPPLQTRVQLGKPPSVHLECGKLRRYTAPSPKGFKKAQKERRKKAEELRNFCKFGKIDVPIPQIATRMSLKVEIPSPEVSKSRVVPRKPSVSPSAGWPEAPTADQLELTKPTSGIILNETKPDEFPFYDSFDLVFQRKGHPPPTPKPRRFAEGEGARRPKKKKKKKKKPYSQGSTVPLEQVAVVEETTGFSAAFDTIFEENEDKPEGEGEGQGDIDILKSLLEAENYLTRQFRRKVSQVSKATSLNEKELREFPYYEEESFETTPMAHRVIQKYRRDSEEEQHKPKARKVKKGTLESHSFTRLKQKTLRNFYFGSISGSMHQGDIHFPEISRNRQGLCMPVAAYCYSVLKHPNKWIEATVDEVLEVGNRLFMESIGNLHIHDSSKDIRAKDLQHYCYIDEKKVRFEIHDPEIAGLIRSDDRTVYNLTKGLTIFFKRHRAAILQTFGLNIGIWKDRHFYLFDAMPRTRDLYPDAHGAALLGNFYDIPSLTTVLLDRSDLGNWPFIISKLNVQKIIGINETDEIESMNAFDERSDYNILSEEKAVISGSFDLGDLCFGFTRNKQAIAMAAVCLVYSRITPPSAWHRKTIDKIMIIGNQLYLECVEQDLITDMRLENIPAVFTIGPYMIEIFIYANRHADLMFKKGACELQKCFEEFFEKNNSAILQIGKHILAVWSQRNMYYCFDPYSRNNEGLKCRSGTACISMNAKLDNLMETITTNFDNKDAIFYIHALKVLKIDRDPAQAHLFPRNVTMNDLSPEAFKSYKMAKSKKTAMEKPVTCDFSQHAMKKLLAGDSPGPSLIEVGSRVDSILQEHMPAMIHKHPPKMILKTKLPLCDRVIDLDSPSLSDTQIDPPRPVPLKEEEEIMFMDFDSFELTVEELELEEEGEEGMLGEDEYMDQGEYEEQDVADMDEAYMAMTQFTEIGSQSLESYHSRISQEVNTEITCGFLPIPREILQPTNLREKFKMRRGLERTRYPDEFVETSREPELEVTQSQELGKDTNFINLPDDTQIIRGTANIATFGTDLEFMAPFICMMSAAVSQKYAIISWSGDVIDYALRCGVELYKASTVRYDQVPKLEIPKVTLGRTDFSISVDYLYDSFMKLSILEAALDRILFPKTDCGLVVTPYYACGVYFKNHLYYMFDPFGCNEVGLGEGPKNTGSACFARFKTIHELATRIMFNKTKRETAEEFEFTRFVLSSCRSRLVPPPAVKKTRKKAGYQEIEVEQEAAAAEQGEGDFDIPPPPEPKGKKEEVAMEPENLVGYKFHNGFYTIQGTKALDGRDKIAAELKEDHFVSLCAALMVLNYPVRKWDTRRVDSVIDQGLHIFSHAANLEISEKRTIRNILIEKYFLDVVIRKMKFDNWRKNKNLNVGIDTMMKKRNYCLVQFPNCSYVIYHDKEFFHLFDPYPCKPNGKMAEGEGKGGWTMLRTLNQLKSRLRENMIEGGESYSFYTFAVASIKKAPMKMVISHRLKQYEVNKDKPAEDIGKPFHEDEAWLNVDPIPWSRKKDITAHGLLRGANDAKWHNWEVEYPKDLFSLVGTLHQTSTKFEVAYRGKQTLANLMVAIAMLEIYDLSEWNSAILDSVLVNGHNYFKECVKEIQEPDYELVMADLISECSIFPYSFEISYTPVVEGTIFLMRVKQFNLYKGLRYFFENYENRCGIICASIEGLKRFVAFGKVQDSEYFMYDCQAYGPPMFMEKQGSSYIMRCTSIERLVHVMVVTLRGGDYYIYHVEISDLKPMN